jgi:hypothetical protein
MIGLMRFIELDKLPPIAPGIAPIRITTGMAGG